MLESAIAGRGLTIAHVSNIADMHRRTGKDIGYPQPLYSHAVVIEFCSAVLSRKMAEQDPTTIVHCPYSIGVYQLAQEQEKVNIALPRVVESNTPADSVLHEVEQLLQDIVAEVI